MSEMSSLFSQMRESRIKGVNEEKEEVKKEEVLHEEKEEVEKEVTAKEEEAVKEEKEENQDEEVSAIFCAECGALVSGSMNESEVDECPCCGSQELLEKQVKVVRDGKVVTKKVRTGAKKRLSAAQKAALAKARKKAHSASANKQRAKSMKKAQKLNNEDELECPECGYEGLMEDFDLDDEGNVICPECGAVVDVNEACGTKSKKPTKKVNEEQDEKEDMKALLESVNAPKYVLDALDEGKTAFVTGYLDLKMGK